MYHCLKTFIILTVNNVDVILKYWYSCWLNKGLSRDVVFVYFCSQFPLLWSFIYCIKRECKTALCVCFLCVSSYPQFVCHLSKMKFTTASLNYSLKLHTSDSIKRCFQHYIILLFNALYNILEQFSIP